jgi:hypothetical protein
MKIGAWLFAYGLAVVMISYLTDGAAQQFAMGITGCSAMIVALFIIVNENATELKYKQAMALIKKRDHNA